MTEFPPLVASPHFLCSKLAAIVCIHFGILCTLRFSFAKATFDIDVGEFEATAGSEYDPLDESDFSSENEIPAPTEIFQEGDHEASMKPVCHGVACVHL